jgi:polyisoprenoid-binding protein YceI
MLMTTDTQVAGKTYALDASHTTIEFVVRHLMITKVRGRFTKFSGTVAVPEGADVPTKIDASIDASSIDTREEKRDDHLRSEDFLYAEKFPALEFHSVSAEGTGEAFRVRGDLTIRGTTRPVTLDGTFEGRVKDPWGNARIGFSAFTTINRKDFGLAWNQALETGGFVVGDEVRIEINVEAIAQP